MRQRKNLLSVAIAVICGVALAFLIPTSRLIVLGAVRGEPFFSWRPKSYWARELGYSSTDARKNRAREKLKSGGVQALPVIEALLAGSWREAPSMACPRVPEAVPILCAAYEREESRSKEPEIVMRHILQALKEIGPSAKESVPLLRAALDGPMWYHAGPAFAAVDPDTACKEVVQYENIVPRDMAFAPDGKTLAILGYLPQAQKRQIRLWTIGTTESHDVASKDDHGSSEFPAWQRLGGFSPDGKRILVVDTRNNVSVVDVATGNEQKLVLAYDRQGQIRPPAIIYETAWDDHSDVLVLMEHGLLRVDSDWQKEHATDLSHLQKLEPASASPVKRFGFLYHKRNLIDNLLPWGRNLDCTPDGKIGAASNDLDDQIQLWNLSDDQPLEVIKHSGVRYRGVKSIAFCADGKLLAGASREAVKIWDVSSRKELASYRFERGPIRMVVSPDGMTLAGLNEDCKTVRLWNLRSLIGVPQP